MPLAKHIIVIDTAGQIEARRVLCDIRPTRGNVVLGADHRCVESVGKRHRPFYRVHSWRTFRAFFQDRSNYVNGAAALDRNRIANSESQQRDNIERRSLAVVHIGLGNPNDYSIGQRDNFSLFGNNSDPGTLACCKFLLRFFQGIACKTALIPRCDQQPRCDNKTEALDGQFIEPCNNASPHRLLAQGLGCLICGVAMICLFAGLIIGGSSRTASVLLFGMLLVAIAFVLSQWASALIDWL